MCRVQGHKDPTATAPTAKNNMKNKANYMNESAPMGKQETRSPKQQEKKTLILMTLFALDFWENEEAQTKNIKA